MLQKPENPTLLPLSSVVQRNLVSLKEFRIGAKALASMGMATVPLHDW